MKLTKITLVTILLLTFTKYSYSQAELSEYVISAYEEDDWVYFGSNTFLYLDKEEGEGNPRVLSLRIDPSDSHAMLYLYEYDCENQRMMMIAYKTYQNKPVMEKENYLFEHKLKWQYPLKTSLGDNMMGAVCDKF